LAGELFLEPGDADAFLEPLLDLDPFLEPLRDLLEPLRDLDALDLAGEAEPPRDLERDFSRDGEPAGDPGDDARDLAGELFLEPEGERELDRAGEPEGEGEPFRGELGDTDPCLLLGEAEPLLEDRAGDAEPCRERGDEGDALPFDLD
jgi:hypothetical protein